MKRKLEIRLNADYGGFVTCVYNADDYDFHVGEGHEMFWSIYINTDRGAEHVGDFKTREYAERVASLLTQISGHEIYIDDELKCYLETQT